MINQFLIVRNTLSRCAKQLSRPSALNQDRQVIFQELVNKRLHHSTIMQQRIPFSSDFFFRQLFDDVSSTYTYLLGDVESKEAILIDPGLTWTQTSCDGFG